MVKGGGTKLSAVHLNPMQVDIQWMRRLHKEELILMDAKHVDPMTGKPVAAHKKVDDMIIQPFCSAYFYHSEYLKNHMYMHGGPHLGGGYG